MAAGPEASTVTSSGPGEATLGSPDAEEAPDVALKGGVEAGPGDDEASPGSAGVVASPVGKLAGVAADTGALSGIVGVAAGGGLPADVRSRAAWPGTVGEDVLTSASAVGTVKGIPGLATGRA
jgi:hypothetical protein